MNEYSRGHLIDEVVETSGHRTDLYRHVCWRTVQEQSKIVIEVQQQNPDCSGPPRQGRRKNAAKRAKGMTEQRKGRRR